VPKINKLAIICNVQISGEKGGAEIFYVKLLECFKKYVPIVDLIEVPCSENTFEDILRGYLSCYDLDLSGYDGVISSKAPTFGVRHSNHVCYLMHTIRVFYDMFDEIKQDKSNYDRRKLIYRMDKEFLTFPMTKKLFSIGHEVSNRLEKYIGIKSEPLHPGITSEGFYCENYDYIFMPGRLHKWKRVDLVIEAMKYVQSPIKLKIAGTGEYMNFLKEMAKDDSRIEFLGFVDDQYMRKLYANSLMVTFTPINEDYGYILHEAFKSYKPVITCNDSGEPTQFIKHGYNGYIATPSPKDIAKYIDLLYCNKEDAKIMGENGYLTIEKINWDSVVLTLLKALEE